jgi:ABC-type lipoprotein release transport system permease subunit
MYRFVLALRYLRARKITYFSVVGVAIGVMALIVVMAVMEGFQRDYKGRIRGTLSDVMIRYRGDEPIGAVLDKISSVPHVVAASPRLKGMALLSSRGRGAVEIVGVDPQREGLVSEQRHRRPGQDRVRGRAARPVGQGGRGSHGRRPREGGQGQGLQPRRRGDHPENFH